MVLRRLYDGVATDTMVPYQLYEGGTTHTMVARQVRQMAATGMTFIIGSDVFNFQNSLLDKIGWADLTWTHHMKHDN